MSQHKSDDVTVTERCPDCDEETRHTVVITLVEESTRETNRKFSREPYRVAQCTECGKRSERRMNDI